MQVLAVVSTLFLPITFIAGEISRDSGGEGIRRELHIYVKAYVVFYLLLHTKEIFAYPTPKDMLNARA